MGQLKEHNLGKIKNLYNIDYLVETGTYQGGAIEHASGFNFKGYFSVEYYEKFYKSAKSRLSKIDNVHLFNGKSPEIMPEILAKIPQEANILFWLDAHLPNDYFREIDDNEKNIGNDVDFIYPLEKELASIINNRDASKDYFVIDDLRIYEDHLFGNGSCPEGLMCPKPGIKFIYDMFSDTHEIIRDLRDEGYIVLKPKLQKIENNNSEKSASIAVVTLYTESIKTYAEQTAETMRSYCKKHGYQFICHKDIIVKNRPASWSKIPAIFEAFDSGADWVFWIDADAIIMNPKVKLESFISKAAGKDIAITEDENSVNCGVFLIRNCEFSTHLLSEIWAMEKHINHIWWENAAMHELYYGDAEIRSHFDVFAKNSFNSRMDSYQEGDFVLHLPGIDNQRRTEIIESIVQKQKQNNL